MNRIAIIDFDKCRPNKCQKECKKWCPVDKSTECVTLITVDIEDINSGTKKKVAKINEDACIGCGQCVKRCPFDAIKIVNIPSEVGNFIIHRYGENGFRLYRMPIMKTGQVLGILGKNGIGKSTIVQILTNNIVPNFEQFDKKVPIFDIISKFKGTEMHKYMEKLYKNKLVTVVKQQNTEIYSKETVIEYIENKLKTKSAKDNEIFDALDLRHVFNTELSCVSGGEKQRILCAITLLTKADVYIFDEPSNFLDIKQRLAVAKLIRKLVNENTYVIVVEHDLALLDYLSDQISIMYGEPSMYGVVTKPYATSDAINIYFNGYIPTENMRFRKTEYNFNDINNVDPMVLKNEAMCDYESAKISFPNFELKIEAGGYPSNTSINVILGENGTGKTTFMNYLEKCNNVSTSYKTQYANIKQYGDVSVEELYLDKIRESYFNPMFKSDVLVPLEIENIKNRKLQELSGGELQRVMIVLCLGTPANVYLLDEPSACLDVEQRVNIVKIVKKFILHNQKVAFVVEHDMMMAISFAQDINSQVIVMKKTDFGAIASKPMTLTNGGINMFLQSLDITFRKDVAHNRMRINKFDSTKDREQKKSGQYF
jgi:ATP-binding cassette subfamily E protein 1